MSAFDLQTVTLFAPATLQTLTGLPEALQTSVLLLLVLNSVWTPETQEAVKLVTEFYKAASGPLTVFVSFFGEASETLAELTRMASPFYVLRKAAVEPKVTLFVLDWLGGVSPQRVSSGLDSLLHQPRSTVVHVCAAVADPLSKLPHLEPTVLVIWQTKCNRWYLEIRDLLFQTRNQRYPSGVRAWEQVLENMRTVQASLCGASFPNKLHGALQSLNKAAQNDRLTKLLLGQKFDCGFFASFLTTLDTKIDGDIYRLFPKRALRVMLQYRSRRWEFIREKLTAQELSVLIGQKIPDINIHVARVFSTPPSPLFDGCLVTEMDMLPPVGENAPLSLLLIDQHNRDNQAVPLRDTKESIQQAMGGLSAKLGPEENMLLFHKNHVLAAGTAIRLIERNEEQRAALTSVPVFELHQNALLRLRRNHGESYEQALLHVLIDWFSFPSGTSSMQCDFSKDTPANACAKAFALAARAVGFEVRIVIGCLSDSNYPTHWWNEVYSGGRWVHVDMSGQLAPRSAEAAEGWNIVSDRAPRLCQPRLFDQPESVPKPRLAIGVGSDDVALVTRRYLSALDAREPEDEGWNEQELSWYTHKFDEWYRATDPRQVHSQYVRRRTEAERNALERRFQSVDELQMGQVDSYLDSRLGTVYVRGGEVPGWRLKKLEHRFASSVNEISLDLRVNKVELCWVPLDDGPRFLTRIKFFYDEVVARAIQPRKYQAEEEEDEWLTNRRSFTRRTGSFGSDFGDSLPSKTQCEEVPIPRSQYISSLNIVQRGGLITAVTVEMAGGDWRVIGVYGSRNTVNLAVDFLGTYEVERRVEQALGRTPPVKSYIDYASPPNT